MKEIKKQVIVEENAVVQELIPWKPTYKWFAKVGGSVLLFLIIAFIIGNIVLKPYMVTPPMDITPWLDSSKPKTSILGI
jgi:hypothetical protein